MRKLFLTVLTAVLLAGGAAFAQQLDTFAGASLGFASAGGAGAFSVAFHGGSENLFSPNLGARGDLNVLLAGGATLIGFGANALFNTDIADDLPLDLYAGGGPRILFGSNVAAFGIGLLGGTEFMLDDQIGLFGELRVDLNFSGGANVPVFGLGLGGNFHF